MKNTYPLPFIQKPRRPKDLGPLPASQQAVLERNVFDRGGPPAAYSRYEDEVTGGSMLLGRYGACIRL